MRLFAFGLLLSAIPVLADPGTFFQANCTACHGPEKQKGKLRLDTLAWEPSDPANLEIWRELVDRVQIGEMPPEDEPQPTPADK